MKESFGQTDLNDADLEGALLEGVKLPDDQYLVGVQQWPDGNTYMHRKDLAKFTDCKHPEFKATLEGIKRTREMHRLVGVPEIFSAPGDE